MKDVRKQLGQYGEQMAAHYLIEQGYEIVNRNWRCSSGEIDIVAEHGDTLVFVEVRTRRQTGTYGTPAESVRLTKQKQVRETAQYYLYRNKAFGRSIRFDVIAVNMNLDSSFHSLQHIRHAF